MPPNNYTCGSSFFSGKGRAFVCCVLGWTEREGVQRCASVDMPGMAGAQLLKTLKDRHKYLEIIILTGHATIDSAVESTKLGAFKYLEKPYAFEKLVEAIKEA